jgi:hypothetical protein
MAATYEAIGYDEMRQFLSERGFRRIDLEGTKEDVYGRRVDRDGMDLSLRVYTSVKDGIARDCGKDAIRVCIFWRDPDNEIRLIGIKKRVNRISTWRKNLANRLDNWEELIGPRCVMCGSPMVLRSSKHGKFWGCSTYPYCDHTENHNG